MKKNELDILKQIKKVEVPPFLLTGIEAKLAIQKPNNINVRWSIGGSLAFSLICFLNFSVINTKLKSNHSQIENLAQELYLSSDNVLYYEY